MKEMLKHFLTLLLLWLTAFSGWLVVLLLTLAR